MTTSPSKIDNSFFLSNEIFFDSITKFSAFTAEARKKNIKI